jgi:hypothetical protein
MQAIGLWSLVACFLAAFSCGREPLDGGDASGSGGVAGSAGSTGSAGAGGPGGGGGATGVAGFGGRVPAVHRPTAMTCPMFAAPTSTMCPFAGEDRGDCNSNSDCTQGQDGRCEGTIPFASCQCSYDECFSDGDCPSGEACTCSGTYSGNACVLAGCRVDADCGVGGYCSPIPTSCGVGIAAYQCHTPRDKCVDDADCTLDESCTVDPSSNAWECAPAPSCPL